jgi:hypothetical protein
MNFDFSYIPFFGHIMFEPVTFAANTLMMLFCLFAFTKIRRYKLSYAAPWAAFFFMIGVSAQLGAFAHSIQYQLGDLFIRILIFLVNATSLMGIYFCFRSAITYNSLQKKVPGNVVTGLVILWIVLLLVIAFIQSNFTVIKIHAGIVLTYSLSVHLVTYFKKQAGSGYISAGILISFLSIVVHSLKISFDKWFNYKDIAHVIMIISLIFIYKGVMIKMRRDTANINSSV